MSDSKLQFWDKLLPNQEPYKCEFTGPDDGYMEALFKIIMKSSQIEMPEDRFTLIQSEKFTIPEMGSNPVSLRFLEMLTRLVRAENVLEIGSFIGVSAMNFAEALPANGKVVTFEKFDHFADICRQNFKSNNLQDKIQLIVGDAFDSLDQIPDGMMFDLIFIDGNKERYLDYFEKLEHLLRPGGLILVDDCFFHGDAINEPPEGEKGAGCRAFLDEAAKRGNYYRLALPISNGIYLMMKPLV